MKTLSAPMSKWVKESYQKVSSDVEIELIRLAKSGDVRAKNKLLNSQLPYIAKMARKYIGINPKAELDDLMQVGCVAGLSNAIENFDVNVGAKFQTYLMWQLKDQFMNYMWQTSQLVPVPMNIVRNNQKVRKELIKSKQYEELAEMQSPFSVIAGMDVAVNDDGQTIADTMSDEAYDVEQIVNVNTRNKYVSNLMNGLNESERKLMEMVYGLDGSDNSLREVASNLGMSHQMVELNRRRIISKLKVKRDLGFVER